MNAIVLSNVSKTLNSKYVLRGINLCIESGDICGIVGGNGAGKSMLLKAVCGLIEIDSGEISVLDHKVGNGKMSPSTGILIEEPGLVSKLSASENLKLLSRSKADTAEIPFTLSRLGLNSQDRRPIRKYSLGMKQKASIAAAIFDKPLILLLDEPTSNLDRQSCNQLISVLKEINIKYKTTILIASHQSMIITNLCNRICTMTNGILSEGNGNDATDTITSIS